VAIALHGEATTDWTKVEVGSELETSLSHLCLPLTLKISQRD
jgi:hypothetical protein